VDVSREGQLLNHEDEQTNATTLKLEIGPIDVNCVQATFVDVSGWAVGLVAIVVL
jgi:hypothetical protein